MSQNNPKNRICYEIESGFFSVWHLDGFLANTGVKSAFSGAYFQLEFEYILRIHGASDSE